MKTKILFALLTTLFIIFTPVYGLHKKDIADTTTQEYFDYTGILTTDSLRKHFCILNSLNDEQGYVIPETKKLIERIHSFHKKYPDSKVTSELLYFAGHLHFSVEEYDNAIIEFKKIKNEYVSSEYALKARIMLAWAYTESARYNEALLVYRELLQKDSLTESFRDRTINDAAGTIFEKANTFRKTKNYIAAADIFKSIYTQFPANNIAKCGLFIAGVCYEEAEKFEMADKTFKNFIAAFSPQTFFLKDTASAVAALKKVIKYRNSSKLSESEILNDSDSLMIRQFNGFIVPCYTFLEEYDSLGGRYESSETRIFPPRLKARMHFDKSLKDNEKKDGKRAYEKIIIDYPEYKKIEK
ncbi:MAG: outer membrane protein assembly factor BamD [Dehalococcoidia bacterium]|nr:MAG: outer membrane protein assembly factor BamD [Dehalococcoidia bacterium]